MNSQRDNRNGIRHRHHVRVRLRERYGIDASDQDLLDLEAAVNTLNHKDFFPHKTHSHVVGCFFWWKWILVHAIVSLPQHTNKRRPLQRHILTVFP